jgi:hypothetical protein
MEASDTVIHSFVLKIYIEESSSPGGEIAWHGYITHVDSSTRGYIKTPGDILEFITPYLEKKARDASP